MMKHFEAIKRRSCLFGCFVGENPHNNKLNVVICAKTETTKNTVFVCVCVFVCVAIKQRV